MNNIDKILNSLILYTITIIILMWMWKQLGGAEYLKSIVREVTIECPHHNESIVDDGGPWISEPIRTGVVD